MLLSVHRWLERVEGDAYESVYPVKSDGNLLNTDAMEARVE